MYILFYFLPVGPTNATQWFYWLFLHEKELSSNGIKPGKCENLIQFIIK